MLDALIIDWIKRQEDERRKREEGGNQPSVDLDDGFDRRPPAPERQEPSGRGVEDVTDWLKVSLSGILGK